MNVQVLNQTTVIPTHCVPIQKDLTFVAASKVLRVMAETAEVKTIVRTFLSFACTGCKSVLITFFFAQPLPLVVFHLVVQMLYVKRVLGHLHVSAILVTKVTDTIVQVGKV